MSRFFQTLSLVFSEFLLCVFLLSSVAFGQQAVEDLNKLVDQKVDIRLTKDVYLVDAIVSSASEGKLPNSIRNLKVGFEGSRKIKNVSVGRVQEIYLAGYPLDVQYDRKNKCLVYSPEQRAARLEKEKLISDRLAVSRDRLWKPLTDAQQEKFMVSHRKFIEKVQRDTPSLRLEETDFFLFLTDLNDQDLAKYIGYLDAMYVELCKAFGLSPEKNIWCGKCVVVAFENEKQYLKFHRDHMDVEIATIRGTLGLCHQFGDGRVIFAGYQSAYTCSRNVARFCSPLSLQRPSSVLVERGNGRLVGG